MKTRGRAWLLAGAATAVLTVGGCLQLSDLSGSVSPSGFGSLAGNALIGTSFQQANGDELFVSCFNSLLADASTEMNIFPAALIAAAVCLDPMLVEVPDGVSNVAGTLTHNGNPLPLIVTGPFACVPTDPGHQICARPGHSIFVVDAPSGLNLGQGSADVAISATFNVNPPGPVEARFISTAKIETTGGETYYPVLFPCVDNFNSAIALTIPSAGSPQPLSPDLTGATVCEEHSINLLGAAGGQNAAPALGWIAGIGTAGGLILLGRSRLRIKGFARQNEC